MKGVVLCGALALVLSLGAPVAWSQPTYENYVVQAKDPADPRNTIGDVDWTTQVITAADLVLTGVEARKLREAAGAPSFLGQARVMVLLD